MKESPSCRVRPSGSLEEPEEYSSWNRVGVVIGLPQKPIVAGAEEEA